MRYSNSSFFIYVQFLTHTYTFNHLYYTYNYLLTLWLHHVKISFVKLLISKYIILNQYRSE